MSGRSNLNVLDEGVGSDRSLFPAKISDAKIEACTNFKENVGTTLVCSRQAGELSYDRRGEPAASYK